MKKTLYILLLLLIFSCKNEETINDIVIAKVGEKHLYASDLNKTLNDYNIDSITASSEIINNWIVKQLEYQEAVKSIGNNDKEIEALVDDYRIFLYIDKYKKEYVKKKLDTIVDKATIIDSYNKNKDLYILKNNIVKATYIKTALKAPKLYKLSKWLKSDKLEDQEQLSAYCLEYAEKYDDFDDNWIDFNDIIKNIPTKITNQSSKLKYSKKIEVRDTTSYYLVYIKDYKLINDTSPVEYIKEDVIKNVLKQRKKDLLIAFKNRLVLENKSKNNKLESN